MAKFDFDEIVNRRGTGSEKWDGDATADLLPMWVADMDFRTSPAIIEALRKRVDHGIFGYEHVSDGYYDALINWFDRRHGWRMRREWIIYTTGVVPAVSAVIKAMTSPGDKVLVQTPVYNCFFSSIRNNGCVMEDNKLVYHDGTYTVDFDDLERKASDPAVKVLFVLSDEIHCDIVMPGYKYTPFASLSDEFLQHSATCTAPTKTFNIAGLQIANITVADKDARQRVDRAININEVCDVGPMGVTALQAAYNHGEEWLEELLEYLHGNYECLKEFFSENMPQLTVTKLEATYLVWVDCSVLGKPSTTIVEELKEQKKLWLNDGEMYGEKEHPFVRINIACSRSVMLKGLQLFADYVNEK